MSRAACTCIRGSCVCAASLETRLVELREHDEYIAAGWRVTGVRPGAGELQLQVERRRIDDSLRPESAE